MRCFAEAQRLQPKQYHNLNWVQLGHVASLNHIELDVSCVPRVTIDDLAVRAGDLHQAQQITAEVAKAALPEFYFHQRGG